MNQHHTSSSAGTKRIAASLANQILKSGPRTKAIIFALTGELGSGKTTFVQGFLGGLGVKRGGTSPTFILMRRHALHAGKFNNVYHIDLYRVHIKQELARIGLREILADPKNIALIEWAENLKTLLPKNSVRLYFRHGEKENKRTIQIGEF